MGAQPTTARETMFDPMPFWGSATADEVAAWCAGTRLDSTPLYRTVDTVLDEDLSLAPREVCEATLEWLEAAAATVDSPDAAAAARDLAGRLEERFRGEAAGRERRLRGWTVWISERSRQTDLSDRGLGFAVALLAADAEYKFACAAPAYLWDEFAARHPALATRLLAAEIEAGRVSDAFVRLRVWTATVVAPLAYARSVWKAPLPDPARAPKDVLDLRLVWARRQAVELERVFASTIST
jgi:hypothetical protein